LTEKKADRITAHLAIGGVSSPLDSFVFKQTLVLRLKFKGENRQLHVAAKRELNNITCAVGALKQMREGLSITTFRSSY
jgi:hypothetical protein